MNYQPLPLHKIQIGLASPDRIRQWAQRILPDGKIVGEVTNAGTLNHKTYKPEPNGLFCERIFGPLKDFECACGKRVGFNSRNNLFNKEGRRLYCKVCEVEYTWAIMRRYRMGYISLASTVTHPWYVKSHPCWLGLLLDFKPSLVQSVIYGGPFLTFEKACKNSFTDTELPSGQELWLAWKQLMEGRESEDKSNINSLNVTSKPSFFIRDGSLAAAAKKVPPKVLSSWRMNGRRSETDQYIVSRMQRTWNKKWMVEAPQMLWQGIHKQSQQALVFQQLPHLQKRRQQLIAKTSFNRSQGSISNNSYAGIVPKVNNFRHLTKLNVRRQKQLILRFERLYLEQFLRGSKVFLGANQPTSLGRLQMPKRGIKKILNRGSSEIPRFLTFGAKRGDLVSNRTTGKFTYTNAVNKYALIFKQNSPPCSSERVTLGCDTHLRSQPSENVTPRTSAYDVSGGVGGRNFDTLPKNPVDILQSILKTVLQQKTIDRLKKTLTQKLTTLDSLLAETRTDHPLNSKVKLRRAKILNLLTKLNLHTLSTSAHLAATVGVGEAASALSPLKKTGQQNVTPLLAPKVRKRGEGGTEVDSRAAHKKSEEVTAANEVRSQLARQLMRAILTHQSDLKCLKLANQLFDNLKPGISVSECLLLMRRLLSTKKGSFSRNQPLTKSRTTRSQPIGRGLLSVLKISHQRLFLNYIPGLSYETARFGLTSLLQKTETKQNVFIVQAEQTFVGSVETILKHWLPFFKPLAVEFKKRFQKLAFFHRLHNNIVTAFANTKVDFMRFEGNTMAFLGKKQAVVKNQAYQNMWSSHLLQNTYGGSSSVFAKRPFDSLRANCQTIYSLSHRQFWWTEDDWWLFCSYMVPVGESEDIAIPVYSKLLYAAMDHTPIYDLGCGSQRSQVNDVNRFFKRGDALPLGAGVFKKLLDELTPEELQKQDKQNRLLFEYCIQQLANFKYWILNWRSQPDPRGKDRRGKYPKYGRRNMSRLRRAREGLVRRTKLVRKMVFLQTQPKNMILSVLPILPPDLRPIVQIGDQINASDLNRLYQRIISRNHVLHDFLGDLNMGDSFETRYAQRMLQEAVDNVVENGKGCVVPECDANGRPLKSLADLLKGKQGRFRQHLLGKRVDYSGRSVIVVGPQLRLHECGIPREMALELFLPFLLRSILEQKLALTIIGAKDFIQKNPSQVNQLLQTIMHSHPVLLNRAPTLHRLGFQAFQPKLVHGRAILLHPLVCPPFNADFDGDQMAVHVPITVQARAEAWKLMFTHHNIMSAATGDPIILPSQDMVLGCYYLTADARRFQKGMGRSFNTVADVLKALDHNELDLHSPIWLKWFDTVKHNREPAFPIEVRINASGQSHCIFAFSHYHLNSGIDIAVPQTHKRHDRWIWTTPGRVLFYRVTLGGLGSKRTYTMLHTPTHTDRRSGIGVRLLTFGALAAICSPSVPKTGQHTHTHMTHGTSTIKKTFFWHRR